MTQHEYAGMTFFCSISSHRSFVEKCRCCSGGHSQDSVVSSWGRPKLEGWGPRACKAVAGTLASVLRLTPSFCLKLGVDRL